MEQTWLSHITTKRNMRTHGKIRDIFLRSCTNFTNRLQEEISSWTRHLLYQFANKQISLLFLCALFIITHIFHVVIKKIMIQPSSTCWNAAKLHACLFVIRNKKKAKAVMRWDEIDWTTHATTIVSHIKFIEGHDIVTQPAPLLTCLNQTQCSPRWCRRTRLLAFHRSLWSSLQPTGAPFRWSWLKVAVALFAGTKVNFSTFFRLTFTQLNCFHCYSFTSLLAVTHHRRWSVSFDSFSVSSTLRFCFDRAGPKSSLSRALGRCTLIHDVTGFFFSLKFSTNFRFDSCHSEDLKWTADKRKYFWDTSYLFFSNDVDWLSLTVWMRSLSMIHEVFIKRRHKLSLEKKWLYSCE